MTPADLTAAQFAKYRPLARQTALSNLPLLQKLPAALVPFLLQQTVSLDWKFPAERDELLLQLVYLQSLAPEQLHQEMAAFEQLHLSPQFAALDWVNSPEIFVEQFSAYLWSSGQMAAFRSASEQYIKDFRLAHPENDPPIPRLAIVFFGNGAPTSSYQPFRKLRREGTYFTALTSGTHLAPALELLKTRAAASPTPYAHWFIDGSNTLFNEPSVTSISYDHLAPIRSSLTAKIRAAFQSRSSPEVLRTELAEVSPADLGMSTDPHNELLNRFKVSLFTEGSGTQIYSTTFVQWTVREALRRARPITLVARFTQRRREASMQELLTNSGSTDFDPAGSLIDGDMGAWYTWINLQRLPGAKQSSFLACLEDSPHAVAVGPAFTRAAENHTPIALAELLKHLSAP
jgi:hypothetical protein